MAGARAALAVGAGIAGVVIAELPRRALASAAFDDTGTYDGFDLASRRGLSDTPEMAVHALGTVAYLVLATAGLALLGVVLLLRSRELRVWYLAMVGAVVLVAGVVSHRGGPVRRLPSRALHRGDGAAAGGARRDRRPRARTSHGDSHCRDRVDHGRHLRSVGGTGRQLGTAAVAGDDARHRGERRALWGKLSSSRGPPRRWRPSSASQ